MRRIFALMLFTLLALGSASVAWWLGYRSALLQVADRGDAYLRAAADQLVAQLTNYRLVAVRLADHPLVVGLAAGDDVPVDTLFRQAADQTGALEIAYHDLKEGRLAASDMDRDLSMPEDRAALARAATGALGFAHGLAGGDGSRVFVFMAPVFDQGRPVGAVSVRVDLEAVEESGWRGSPHVAFFTDDQARIFVSNRSELLFQSLDGASLVPEARNRTAGIEVWRLNEGRYVPDKAAYRSRDLPVIGLKGHVLVSTEPADRIAALQAAVVAALFLAFGAIIYLSSERRRALAQANAGLEMRVADRTEALARANENLRHEVIERQDAEAALRRAQADLVQAGKLTALGQMSAGISHELNQPLMAIRSFSENAGTFLDKNRPADARANLHRISDLAHRMARIIKNLRAFARQETEPVSDIDIVAVVDTTLDLLEPRFLETGASLRWSAPPPVRVSGGEVRLQQVVTNLVSNALDAMAAQDGAREVEITVSQHGTDVWLRVSDTGPGLDDPDKIFDPFYTTKTVGTSEDGMGLGLSISYGLVQSFGGEIKGQNRDGAGAVFTVKLRAAQIEEAVA